MLHLKPSLWGPLASRVFSIRFANTEASVAEAGAELVDIDEDEVRCREEEIENKRNKSRLSSAHFNRLHGRPEYAEPCHWSHGTVAYQRRRYGMFGEQSNVNPGICWMDRDALAQAVEYDQLVNPMSVMESASRAREARREAAAAIVRREQHIQANVDRLGQWQLELQRKVDKKLGDAQAAKAKKDRLVEEVRRHFGFKVDHRDVRFQDMLAEKEKAQRKSDKLAKKAAKEAELIARLQQKNVVIS